MGGHQPPVRGEQAERDVLDADAAVVPGHRLPERVVQALLGPGGERDVLAIPGTGNPDHLDANVAAAALRLSPGEMARLDSVS
jgi:aryl-alcohol dehydrogenase-like predicted oxidoreductase